MKNNTIVAISTPVGFGAISIVRISGTDALNILQKIFVPKTKSPLKTHRVYYGHIKERGQTIDEVLVTLMLAPNSYTKEDIIEINCHGGHISGQAVLATAISAGATMAAPGEFTKRAFLNGRIDLTQAEAVMDIINATSATAHNMALNTLGGGLGKKIEALRKGLLDCIASLEVAIDYPQEDYFVGTDVLMRTIEHSMCELNEIIQASEGYDIIKRGINTVILGRPNVGKSSLLNALLKQDRAIVTDMPGTTRDTITAHFSINHIPLNIIDTAGIRKTKDKVEQLGVARTYDALQSADLALVVVDISQPLTDQDNNIIQQSAEKKQIVICNKTDKGKCFDVADLATELAKNLAVKPPFDKTDLTKKPDASPPIVEISATTGQGLEQLKDAILAYYPQIDVKGEIAMANMRHIEILQETLKTLELAAESIKTNQSEEFVSLDITAAYTNLGKILGEETGENIIDKIFRDFCLGK
ncbi:MAG: tRNA uridine-5-carboxymethylaminomethyl(34) synthesis GTPase MnmE [Defluviitaleaceae bacterium]|nr:tRNA uridine-5-carboxymethylaminomethyl(34) synthesis GTPase MnmE [Defluviitaleaceae bacterium]